MKIEKLRNGSSLTLKLSGRLDTVTAPELEREIVNGLDGVTDLVMDFSDLDYISSAGLRTLLFTTKQMSQKGTFVIRNVREEVKEILEVTGFMDVLNVE